MGKTKSVIIKFSWHGAKLFPVYSESKKVKVQTLLAMKKIYWNIKIERGPNDL